MGSAHCGLVTGLVEERLIYEDEALDGHEQLQHGAGGRGPLLCLTSARPRAQQ